jgi:hemerythrin
MAVIWRKEMSVANTVIDEDHRYLMCLANTMELALRTKDNRDILELAVDQLLDYTEYHFAREEALQYKIQYPKFDEHRAEHLSIIGKVRTLREQLNKAIASGRLDEVSSDAAHAAGDAVGADAVATKAKTAAAEDLDPAQIVALMRHWVLDHILKRDREMIPYLEQYPPNYS